MKQFDATFDRISQSLKSSLSSEEQDILNSHKHELKYITEKDGVEDHGFISGNERTTKGLDGDLQRIMGKEWFQNKILMWVLLAGLLMNSILNARFGQTTGFADSTLQYERSKAPLPPNQIMGKDIHSMADKTKTETYPQKPNEKPDSTRPAHQSNLIMNYITDNTRDTNSLIPNITYLNLDCPSVKLPDLISDGTQEKRVYLNIKAPDTTMNSGIATECAIFCYSGHVPDTKSTLINFLWSDTFVEDSLNKNTTDNINLINSFSLNNLNSKETTKSQTLTESKTQIDEYKKQLVLLNAKVSGYQETKVLIKKDMILYISSHGSVSSSSCNIEFTAEGTNTAQIENIACEALIKQYKKGALLFKIGDHDIWRPYSATQTKIIAEKDGILEFTINLKSTDIITGDYDVNVSQAFN